MEVFSGVHGTEKGLEHETIFTLTSADQLRVDGERWLAMDHPHGKAYGGLWKLDRRKMFTPHQRDEIW